MVRTKLANLFLAVIAGLILPLTVLAQNYDAEVDFFVRDELAEPITVGDQVTLRLQVRHAANAWVELPPVTEQWGDFEVLSQTEQRTVDNQDGTATTSKDIMVTMFIPGLYQTPGLNVVHVRPDEVREELAAPIVQIQVTSILTEDSTLQDIKPQANLPTPPLWPWILGGIWLAALAATLLASMALWYYYRQRTPDVETAAAVPFIDTRPPHVIAYAELDRIAALNLPSNERYKEHYALISDCLRRYIEGRYNIPALEKTTAEVRDAFAYAGAPMYDVQSFMNILSDSDLVKFARYVPNPNDAYALIYQARDVVDRTSLTAEPSEEVPA